MSTTVQALRALSPRRSLRALSGSMGSEWERERRDTLFLMGTIGLSVLPHIAGLPVWVSLAFAAMFVWRLTLIFSGRALPNPWIRGLGAVAAIAMVFAQYGSLIGREQGVAMLTLFLGLKLLEMKARRDLFVTTFLCFFLLLTSFFHSQSPASVVLVLVAVIALVATMITMQFAQREYPVFKRFRHAAIIVLQALPIAIAMFVLFPRLAAPLWGMQGPGTEARTGLSDSMSPGAVSSLSKSSAIALRARFNGAVPPTPALYWRGPVFGDFDGTTWRAGGNPADVTVPNVVTITQGQAPVSYVVTLEPSGQPWLPALDMPGEHTMHADLRASVGNGIVLRTDRAPGERLRYSVQSHLAYRTGLNETPASLRQWLALPDSFNPKSIAMARRWKDEAGTTSAQDIATRALRMFREQPFVYTLQPPLLGRDSVDDFLFGERAGFCEHYASSFVVLMRAAGIPARVVTGYQGGKINPVDGYMVVRQSDAHAWAEYWSSDKGWIRADPTGAVAPERIESTQRLYDENAFEDRGAEQSLLARLSFNLEALANRWNQWVLNYDRNAQGRLLERLGFNAGDWGQLAAMLAGALVLLIGGSALLTMQPRDARDPLAQVWREFCNRMAAAGLVRLAHETPAQFGARALATLDPESATQAKRVVDLYSQLRYGAMSDVYLGKERRRLDRGTPSRVAQLRSARQAMRGLKAAVAGFEARLAR